MDWCKKGEEKSPIRALVYRGFYRGLQADCPPLAGLVLRYLVLCDKVRGAALSGVALQLRQFFG